MEEKDNHLLTGTFTEDDNLFSNYMIQSWVALTFMQFTIHPSVY